MSKNCLKHAFIHHGSPVVFISVVSVLFGAMFLWLGNGAGWSLIFMSLGLLAVFSLLGAREGCLSDVKMTGKFRSPKS